MRLVIGLLAASFLGAEGPKTPDASTITYQIRLLEMNGLEWRGAFHAQLQPVARQGAATVWTLPREAADTLAGKAGRVIAAPRMSSYSQARATFTTTRNRTLVTGVSRQADGPVNHATVVGFLPRIERATEGWSANVSGRRIDQGVLAQVALEDREITAVHSVTLSEVLEPKAADLANTCNDPVRTSIQVPEVVRAEVSGEWLIPNDGVLVVSFGAHTVADRAGKAVVRERLAVVEARPADEKEAVKVSGPVRASWTPTQGSVNSLSHPTPPGPVPFPLSPSRSLPLPFHAAGAPLDLPPLPDDRVTPTALPGSSEPCASPQTKTESAGEPIPISRSEIRDNAMTRVGYAPADSPAPRPAPAKGWTPSPGKPFSLRIPLGEGRYVEVRTSATATATASPTFSADVPPPPVVRGSKGD